MLVQGELSTNLRSASAALVTSAGDAPHLVVTASYDGSVRALDINASKNINMCVFYGRHCVWSSCRCLSVSFEKQRSAPARKQR